MSYNYSDSWSEYTAQGIPPSKLVLSSGVFYGKTWDNLVNDNNEGVWTFTYYALHTEKNT
ncbi:hypothetical protein BCR32DRAFT_287117 [Anaeromyces robustus]|uniref:Uncharacterized protein n=1 Tax=Anaeromyces robustus TaxID=1754192 RepID=A0A1Y1VTP0_9FUNG|nr:hypothetical protein BCR32DRAFT_287117 [Anaeromyces robustus]|eukprot:ORX64386.1 hypothetical protein BCR32DRAFT_287117 [Anaeromyces robustus]